MSLATYRKVLGHPAPARPALEIAFGKAEGGDYTDPLDVTSATREAEARRLWLVALRNLQTDWREREARNALEARDLRRLVRALSTERFAVGARAASRPAGREFTRGARAEAATLRLTFERVDTRGEAWAAERAARLVVEITEDTRAAIRAIVRTAFSDGLAPRVIAPRIRGLIGLHSRWARAVYRFQARLEQRGLAAEIVQARTSRYYNRLLRVRSENIARTETLSAANGGKMAAWREAADQGLVNPETASKTWVAAPDERTCPTCDLLDGEIVALGELFGGTFDMPPAHPSCRCTASLYTGFSAETSR